MTLLRKIADKIVDDYKIPPHSGCTPQGSLTEFRPNSRCVRRNGAPQAYVYQTQKLAMHRNSFILAFNASSPQLSSGCRLSMEPRY